jgi:threonylcarbamoyladenosine tRNA methylthiotransferase MtaB
MITGLHVTTLGCKLNQLDGAELAAALAGRLPRIEDPATAALVVVNTCSVTAGADADARQIVRRRRRENPRALIVVTGCYAERDPEALRRLPEVDLVLRREDRPAAAAIILEHLRRRFPDQLADGCADRLAGETLPDFGGRTRAYLRVQEGCDLRCSYCIIPAVRGPSRSVLPDEVERRFRALLGAGYKEIVLTGVNTGDYGRDLGCAVRLAGLLARLADIGGDYRVRLNSVEPRCVTPELTDLMARHPRVARHLQIPLQSGSDAVLRAMRRNYRTADYLRIVEDLRARIPDIGIGADVIVGFPSETRERFAETLDFIERSPLNYLHVFSWSPRPGTDAAGMRAAAAPGAVAERSRVLRGVGQTLARAFRLAQQGRTHDALVLGGGAPGSPARALTSNFIEAELLDPHPGNTFATIRITKVDAAGRAYARAA